jgi:hypothetical protein
MPHIKVFFAACPLRTRSPRLSIRHAKAIGTRLQNTFSTAAPTVEQVTDLIDGTDKIIETVA